ncbi:MAG TPA: hypothetical protein VEN81_03085, partial [Planctomycetota bacterium]|nr:hypothetical protein [Planctomycetota bacterium]
MLDRALRITLLALLCGAGCTVYVRGDPPPQRVYVVQQQPPPPPPPPQPPPPPPPAPAPQPVVQVDWEAEEVHTVVYREYFGASDAEIVLIPHYRRYYYWTDDDIYFLWFVSRRANVSFEVCCNNYYHNCGGDYNRLIVSYNVPRASFFVSVNVGGSYPPVYARTYAAYNSNSYNVSFTHEEYHALVSMKVGVEYQGHAPGAFMAKVQAGTPPNRVVVQSRESCGKGGVTVTGAAVVHTQPHPWTLPPAQRQQWQKDHQTQVAKGEVGFKEQHKDQVQKVQQKEKEQAQLKARDPKTPA